MKREHRDEVHTPDPDTHRRRATRQPREPVAAAGGGHPPGQVQCRIGCQDRDDDGQGDEAGVMVAGHKQSPLRREATRSGRGLPLLGTADQAECGRNVSTRRGARQFRRRSARPLPPQSDPWVGDTRANLVENLGARAGGGTLEDKWRNYGYPLFGAGSEQPEWRLWTDEGLRGRHRGSSGVIQIYTKRGDPTLTRPQVDVQTALGLVQNRVSLLLKALLSRLSVAKPDGGCPAHPSAEELVAAHDYRRA